MFSRGSFLQFPQQPRYPRPRANRHMEEIKCDVCCISVRGQDQYNSHLSGSKHTKKMAEKENTKKIEEVPIVKYDQYSGGYECTICQVSLNSSSVAVFHIMGNRHREKMKEANSGAVEDPSKGSTIEPDSMMSNGNNAEGENPDTKQKSPTEVVPLMSLGLPSKFGSAKNVQNDSANLAPNRSVNDNPNVNHNNYKGQNNNVNHNNYMGQNNAPIRRQPYPAGPNFRPRVAPLASSFVSKYTSHTLEATIYTGMNSFRPRKQPRPSPASKQTYPCLACNIVTNSEQQLQQHLSSEKHKNRLAPDGAITAKPVAPAPPARSALRCESCGISVNSQIQLDQHLQSPKHRKQLSRYHPYHN